MKKSNKQCETDMTPMIDVVFQLIIFFIVTIKMDEKKEDIELFSDINTGHIHVGAPEELDRDIRLARTRNGAYQTYISDNADGFLDGLG